MKDHQILSTEEFGAIVRTAAFLAGVQLDASFDETERKANVDIKTGISGCEASVRVSKDWSDEEMCELNRDGVITRRRAPVKVELSWCSMIRSTHNATVAVTVYQKAIQFASAIEAACAGKFFVY